MKVGIIGSSVASMMLCVELAKMGIETSLLDADLYGIGSNVATEHIAMAVTQDSIKKLSLRCDKIICNTKLDFAIEEKLHAPIFPNKNVLNEVCNPKSIVEICEMLEIPTVETYYLTDKKQVLEKLREIQGPFKIGFEVDGFMQQRSIFGKEELTDFLMEFGDIATSYMVQPIEYYDYTISCICFTDVKGKLSLYAPMSIGYDEDETCILRMGNHITKTMTTRLNRYNRKIMKEIDSAGGAFTIRYGVKYNKSVELIDVLPELGIGSLLTIEGYDVSIFEQYARLVNNMKIYPPNLETMTYARVWKEKKLDPELDGVIYRIDDHYMNVRKQEEEIEQ